MKKEGRERKRERVGIIKECNKYIPKCHHKCCVFTDNYILLYPGEWEKSKLSKNHLKIIDASYFGGKKAICTLGHKGCNPKKEFKPLDCKGYPYFPKIDKQGNIQILKGKKCLLTKEDLIHHKKLFLKVWNSLIKNKVIFNWLKKAELSGDYKLEK